MPTINQQIDKILDMRLGRGEYEGKGHLQDVEAKINALETIRDSIIGLYSCIAIVNDQISKKSGDFYKALFTDADAMTAYNQIDCISALTTINEALIKLQNLKCRFEREAVRIAFIGYERQGKSTFLQSMTGLPNEVIPAYDGTSCTGAVSVIHNEQTNTPFRAEIVFYTLQEFLDNVKAKLKLLIPDKSFVLNSIDDLSLLDLSDYKGSDRTEIEKLIKKGIIEHRCQYGGYLGIGTKTFTDKDEVMKFVAQYREYEKRSDIPANAIQDDIEERVTEMNPDGTPKTKIWRHKYYWYLAVKSVNIYCQFPNAECGRIEFVDTVGLGPSVNADGVEKEMFRVLCDDCDGAIDVYCPAPTGGSLDDKQERIFKKLKTHLAHRNPQMWMSYAINAIPSGNKKNIQNIPDIKGDLELKDLPFGFYVDVNAAKREDVNDLLLVPHLEMVAKNLPFLDTKLIEAASETATYAYNLCQDVLTLASKVLPLQALSDWRFEQDGYTPLNKAFAKAINNIDHDGYAKKKDQPCEELVEAYSKLINEIDIDLPTEEEIVERFQTGHLLTVSGMYDEIIEEMRNGIFSVFEDVNKTVLLPLQEKVKLDLITLLYDAGKWSHLPLPAEEQTDELTTGWLENILEHYVPREKYPRLFEALRFILDYQISIEGLAEYRVTESLHIIEKDHQKFIPYDGANPDDFAEKGAAVWQELAARLLPVQKNLRSWIKEFSLIPSHSFYSRVHKFHIKVGTDVEGIRDFKNFYHDNMGVIWHDEIEAKAHQNAAFKEWTECIAKIRKALATKLFTKKKSSE